MTNRIAISIAALAATLGGCSSAEPGTQRSSHGSDGSAELKLDLPNGESTDSIDLHLTCSGGVDVQQSIDVTDGEAVASFGGLSGECTATMTAETSTGTVCSGSTMFTVVAGEVTPVTVTLTCSGDNGAAGGGIRLDSDFVFEDCSADRLAVAYAIPGSILLGASTDVQAVLHDDVVVGTPTFAFAVLNDATNTAEADLADTTCAAGSDGCQEITCTGLGSAVMSDPITGLPSATLYVQVAVSDDDCNDTELVQVRCLEASTCGDGSVEGVEQCDDGNLENGDGCTDACQTEVCGDGVVNNNGTEECDGSDGVGEGQSCSPSCTLVTAPICGDGIVSSELGEGCDGEAGLLPGQVCGADCQIQPVCGNAHVEGSEECDDGNLENGDGCTDACANEEGGEDPCLTCVTTGDIATNYTNDFCSSSSDPLCAAVLSCYIESTCFATAATVAECYCGIGADTTACEQPGFVTSGPCDAEMLAAAGEGALNADVLARVFDFTYSIGWAGQIMLEAQANCPAACGFPTP